MDSLKIKELNEAIKHTNSKSLYERYLSVRLHLEGYTFFEISKILGLGTEIIDSYCVLFQKEGLRGLAIQNSQTTRGKSKMNDDECKQLIELLIHKRPTDVGFKARDRWTLNLIVSWIKKEFGHEYTRNGVSLMLRRLSFDYNLATSSSKGRPPKMNDKEDKLLTELLIQKLPSDVGFENAHRWTLSLIASWIKKEFGHEYSTNSVRLILRRLGFSSTLKNCTLF